MSDELRPVGTEFDYCYPPNESSATQAFTVYRYRVKAHSAVAVGNTSRLAETWEPIDMKRYVVSEYRRIAGRWFPVPPPECLPFLDSSWRKVIDA